MTERARSLLWLDGGAGCVVGLLVVTLREWLAAIYSFPLDLVLFFGLSNLAYSSYSTTLAVLASTWRSASVLGLASVALEGIFVGSLAYAEYRFLLKR